MPDEVIFDLSATALVFAILGLGMVSGFLWGNYLGMRRIQRELHDNGWTPMLDDT